MSRQKRSKNAPRTGSLKTVSIPIKGSTLLDVENLTVTFPTVRGPVDVVKDSSFRIDPGKTLGIVGESGSGKSMTSLAIMGLLPEGGEASGRIRFFGHDLLDRSDREMRRVRGDKIAMIFQDPLSSLNPYYTVGVQIAEAYRAHRGGSKAAAKKVAVDAMRRVKIADPEQRVDHYPHQFSGGMRQRIMIAMALCLEPDLVIADEPTTALDVTVQAQILDLMKELQEETGTGMLFITHDLAVVSEVADEVLVMKGGETMEHGTAEEIFSNPQSSYTTALLDAVPRITDVVGDIKGVSHE
ncbi:ABC transporter ATP-binding protein [Microbacterium sp. MPKO10]|uniref:ABC transporter ATP-binding protein n=1 Tax=Microbacterium sp. MPKO10 TaxID=2989818 RepID=UPI0022369DC0|nr:ABC transporter ATP-binding protein [Microbacterium sp. MPKO10]MCW4459984.1 ABC transporter ATP-binding protein [Microbacterium sp. MPKO10]